MLVPLGASRFTSNSLGRTIYLCVAVKNRVIIFEINNTQKNKCEKKKVRSKVASLYNELSCLRSPWYNVPPFMRFMN